MCKVSNVLGMAINDKPHSFLVDSILFGFIIIRVTTILKVKMIRIKEQKEKKQQCAIVLSSVHFQARSALSMSLRTGPTPYKCMQK